MPVPLYRSFLLCTLGTLCLTGTLVSQSAGPLGPDHPLEERVTDLISRMTLEEKASQLVSWPPAIPRLGIPAFVWDNEGKHAFVASFPVSIGLAATWDPEITRSVAAAISDEARAQNNQNIRDGKTQRYLCFWAPTVNMARDPRWGRVNESFGEDPFLTSKLSIGFINGMQGDDPHYLKAAAGVNHFAVYSEERDRHSVDATLNDERLLRDYYLPHFEASVNEGKAAAVGATNNGLDGVPLCVNRLLLSNILRQEWGFKGFVFSDAASVEDIWQLRGYAPDGASAAAMTIGAGCEISTGMGNTHLKYLPEAVKRGLLSEAAVDEACRRVFTVQFRLGIYDPPEMVPYTRIPETVIDSQQHRELALKAARESIVLLKNEKSLLPLDLKRLKRIVVAGPRADQPELGRKQTGASAKNISALEGIRNQATAAGVEVVYEKDAQASVKAATSADVVLFFTSVMEGEVCDRMNLGLSPRQEQQLLDLTATKTPVVVVLIGSGSVLMEHWVDRVPAMLSAWYPGKEGGHAIADILFGRVNPCGKLPVTFYRSAGQLLPFEEFNIRKGHTYLYCDTPVQWPFGHGLSYTTFRYSDLCVTPDKTREGHFTVNATVTNTGSRDGTEVSQLYLHAKQRSTHDQPIQELRGFEKFTLKPGESRKVTWQLTPRDFAFHDESMSHVVEPGEIELRVGGSSSGGPLKTTVTIHEKITLRKAADFRLANLSLSTSTVAPDEPFQLKVDAENTGETTGAPRVFVDGKAHSCEVPQIGPGEKTQITVTLRLYESGVRRIRIGDLPEVLLTVKPGPAHLVCQSMDAGKVASVGEPFPVRFEVTNLGGKSGVDEIPFTAEDSPLRLSKVSLGPGETTSVTLNHRFDHPGNHSLKVDGLPPFTVQVGGPVDARFRTFANTPVADFRQSSPGSFFIRATGAIGSSWIEENNGGDATWDAYAALYLPAAAKKQCVVTVKIDSQELVSNHTKSGIMIRNAINRPGESPGYLIFGINGYYGGIGNIEWDADQDGYLESHAVFDPGGFPKWLAVEKNGYHYRFFSSSDSGRSWQLQRQLELPASNPTQDVGLFVASDTEARPALVQFSDFSITEGLFSGNIATASTAPEPKPEEPF